MQPRTMAIASFENEKDARAAGHTIPLSKDEARELGGMNRKERRGWLAQERKAAHKRLKQLKGKK
ncbi:MAG TPA: hypothetical protein VHO25_22120 [Polyangiaceae bacterium]|nr:hypothetical protein [Polyangiaceae bacterium]